MNITTNSRSNHSEPYTVATSGVMINRLHNVCNWTRQGKMWNTIKK